MYFEDIDSRNDAELLEGHFASLETAIFLKTLTFQMIANSTDSLFVTKCKDSFGRVVVA